MHDHLRTVLVAPMTTAGREAPFRIGIHHGGRKGLILLDQVRAVDKTRLAKKLGVVPAKTLTATLRTLQEVFAEWDASTWTNGIRAKLVHPSRLVTQ
jgi:mRNA interferase MazF